MPAATAGARRSRRRARCACEALVLRRQAALIRALVEFGCFDPLILEPEEPAEGDVDAGQRQPRPTRSPSPAALGRRLRAGGPPVPGLDELDIPAVRLALARLYRFLPPTGEPSRRRSTSLARERPLPTLDAAIDEVVACVAELYDLTEPLRYKVETVRRDAAQGRPQRPLPVRQRPQVQAVPRRAGVAPRLAPLLMRLQLLSDLHLETECYDPEPAPGAELLVLAGDIDAGWHGLELFRDWPQPVLFVAGNHEFDGRDLAVGLARAARALRRRSASRCSSAKAASLADAGGARIRFVATTRWCDFDLFGATRRPKAMRAAAYFMDLMQAQRDGRPFDVEAVRDEGAGVPRLAAGRADASRAATGTARSSSPTSRRA